MKRTFLSVLVTLAQDAGMKWLHTLMVFVPLLIGVQGGASGFDNHLPVVVETKPVDGFFAETGSDTPRVQVLAGKRAGCGVEAVPAKQHQKGVTPPKNEAQVDHVVPRAKGGEGEPDNGQILCRDCNIKKSDKAP